AAPLGGGGGAGGGGVLRLVGTETPSSTQRAPAPSPPPLSPAKPGESGELSPAAAGVRLPRLAINSPSFHESRTRILPDHEQRTDVRKAHAPDDRHPATQPQRPPHNPRRPNPP